MAKQTFQTEVSQLLQLIIHSLYSQKEIFLRELISNSSDALDKLKYLTLTQDEFKSMDFEPRIDIEFEEGENPTLTIKDSGIGMSKKDFKDNLGTIARSGTKNFLSKMSGDAKKDSNLIGQFGVGFYSCFMVADKVDVISKKAGNKQAHKWTSDGKSGYEIVPDKSEETGTTIVLHLNDEGKEKSKTPKTEQINDATAFWKRPKNELKKKDYNEFYKTLSYDSDSPLDWVHSTAEGMLEFTVLFFIPKKAPADIYRADYQPGVKLYVNRVFITDDEKELLPTWLRFVKGVIDSSDLPLNVSREILQQNRVMSKIKSNSVKKVLDKIKTISKNKDKYEGFYNEFGRLLKEGVYQEFEHKEALTELLRFKSTKEEGFVSLQDYLDRMSSDQESIYYITGTNESALRDSPLLEMYKEKDIEVLILDDEIDEIIMPSIPTFKEKSLKSVNRSGAADELNKDGDKDKKEELKPLIKKVKSVLGDKVKDVKSSSRLSDSPSCIVADENDPTAQMQEIMRATGQVGMPEIKPILEINPGHKIIKKLSEMRKGKAFDDGVLLIYEQALLQEGVKLDNPAGFVKRLNKLMEKSL